MQTPEQPDLTSVKTLTKHPTELSRVLGITPYAINRWRKVNRIPGKHVIAVANFYNLEIVDLLPLTGSDLSFTTHPLVKPRDTLPTLINVQKGLISRQQASAMLDLPMRSVNLVMTHWGEKLEHLYDILTKIDLGVISIGEACAILDVTKTSLHAIRRKYGFAPGPRKSSAPKVTLPSRKASNFQASLRVLRGEDTATAIAKEMGISTRTIFRKIDEISSLKINDLSEFPRSFRQAYADEIEKNLPKMVEKWLEIAKSNRFFVRMRTKYPETPATWRDASVPRMLVGTLLSEAPLDEIAASRGADPVILKGLFTSHLRLFDMTWAEASTLGINHQFALAELLLWSMDRMRKVI